MKIKIKEGMKVDRDKMHNMIRAQEQKQPTVNVRSSETGKIHKAKLEYAKELQRKGEYKIVD